MIDADGRTIYDSDTPVFFQDGNSRYYTSEATRRTSLRKLAAIQRVVRPGKRLLDVGSGFGFFAKEATAAYDVCGVELSPTAVEWGRRHLDAPLQTGSIYDLAPLGTETFDVATLWDVIEHIPDPWAAVRQIAGRLVAGGHLFLSTPDTSSLAARLLGRHWWYLDPVQHIVLFNPHNLFRILEGSGFTVERVYRAGSYYDLGYVLRRLAHLYGPGSNAGRADRRESKAAGMTVYLNTFDVMTIQARKSPDA